MASTRSKIGLKTVAALTPGDVVFDTTLPRFGVRRGAKFASYFIIPRVDGRQRWITVGRDGPLTLGQARSKAKELLAAADLGDDPTRVRDAAKSNPLFRTFADTWLETHVAIKRKPTTAREYRRIVEKVLKPKLGKIRIDRITRRDAMELHSSLAAHGYQANRALAVLSAIMTHAESLGHRPPYSNPARGVERFKELKRKRPLSAPELSALWRHLNALGGEVNPFIIAAFKLLILTGMRREEVLSLQWRFVDMEAGVIRLPDTKTGPRDVLLSVAAIEVLHSLPRAADNPYVLPGAKDGQRLVNISDRWQEIRSALGFPDVRIHDLRHTVASVLAKTEPLVVVRDALGHREIGTTSGYSHASQSDVRSAFEGLSAVLGVGGS